MELAAQKEKATGEKGPATVLELGPTLYRGVSATQAMETGRVPSSPIAVMYLIISCVSVAVYLPPSQTRKERDSLL